MENERYLTEEQDKRIMDLIWEETKEASYIEQCMENISEE